MPRFFNTTGPCNPEMHYMLPPKRRLVGAQLDRYIESQLYWVLHAPRQTGKTTFLQSWMREINAGSQAVSCYVSVERCQQFFDAQTTNIAICEAAIEYARAFLPTEQVPHMPSASSTSALSDFLSSWSALLAPKPLILLFDEVDVLQDQAMISFLRQLRGGFAKRRVGAFPVSVALVGMRDLKDYLIKSKDGQALNPGSPFNIKQDSASLSNFDKSEVFELIEQHRRESGQSFTPLSLERVWDFSRGQPWLTNSLLQKCIWQICPHGETVEPSHILEAKEMLIKERAVHLDSLAERLKDPYIKEIIETILTGDLDPQVMQGDSFRMALDLGLVTIENGSPEIANPIYREVIARVLSEPYQLSVPPIEFVWQKEDGSLDLDALLKAFQKFWRRHSDTWELKADYTEAFPHLLLMAFLQRVLNGGGRIDREYAAGRGRVDLAVHFKEKVYIIEIKLVHPADGHQGTLEEGLRQTNKYRQTLDSEQELPCFLVLFDRTPSGRQKTWEERLSWESYEHEGYPITVVGG